MKRLTALFLLCFVIVLPISARQNPTRQIQKTAQKKKPATKKHQTKTAISQATEAKRKQELIRNLSKDFPLSALEKIFYDPRLKLYQPSAPPPKPGPPQPKRPRGNPYLSSGFGLLTDESFERCRTFYGKHARAFDAAQEKYSVPKEVICGHLRIETNFGTPTAKTPHPLGRNPVVNSLYSLYVRRPKAESKKFAFNELKCFLHIAPDLNRDIFEIPGSPTGAFGIGQFEPCSYMPFAADGNGDGAIDLFDGDDAVASTARFLTMHGWTDNPRDQDRAIYGYYGRDPKKYYLKAVRKYAESVREYLKSYPLEQEPALHE